MNLKMPLTRVLHNQSNWDHKKKAMFECTYLLNNWTLMNENIWVNTLRTRNGGTCTVTITNKWGTVVRRKTISFWPYISDGDTYMVCFHYLQVIIQAFHNALPRAINACCATALAWERPFTKLARDVLGACIMKRYLNGDQEYIGQLKSFIEKENELL